MTRGIDILYAGPLQTDTWTDIQVLLDIGKAPLGWIGEFTPTFLLPFDEFSQLPAGIAMHTTRFSEASLREALTQTRFVLRLPSNELFLESPEVAQLISAANIEGILTLKDFSSVDELVMKVVPAPVYPHPHIATQSAQKSLSNLLEMLADDFQKSDFKLIHATLANSQLKFPNQRAVDNFLKKTR